MNINNLKSQARSNSQDLTTFVQIIKINQPTTKSSSPLYIIFQNIVSLLLPYGLPQVIITEATPKNC